MSIAELKNSVIQKLEDVGEPVLKDVLELLKFETSGGVYKVTNLERASIEIGLRQIADGEIITHEQAYGVPAFKVTTTDGVDDAIRKAQAVDGPALIWFETVEEQNVFPIMPAGKGLSDLIETWVDSTCISI